MSFFFFKQKTAYEMRISDWSPDVCSSDLPPRSLADRELAHPGLTQLHVVGSMHERKAMMAKLSDGFIALPGGLGTFEELFEIWTWAQLGYHRKPVALLNVDGYYDGLLSFLDHTVREAFVKTKIGRAHV